jgi:drug/metabolite transporter (DMT)-like permease
VALLVLGVLGTGFAYILNLRVIQDAGPTIASTVTYVIPFWSTAIGAFLLAEPVSWNTFVGAALVVAGIVVTRLGASRPPRTTVAPAPQPGAEATRGPDQ